jgi:hypothetical protein
MLAMREAGPIGISDRLDSDELIDRLENRRKRRRIAYLCWVCLGSHYLYLRRPLVQALFWLTLGGALFWWIADFFRMPALVAAGNRRAAGDLLRRWQAEQLETHRPAPWPIPAPAPVQEPAPRAFEPTAFQAEPATPLSAPLATSPGRIRKGALAALALSLLTILVVQIVAPRPFYPHSLADPSFRTLREVNAREAPSTSSPIKARIEGGVVLSGEIEEVSTKGPSRWLRITRGRHADRYVALSNLREY